MIICVIIGVQLLTLVFSRSANVGIARDHASQQLTAGLTLYRQAELAHQERLYRSIKVLSSDYGLRETVALAEPRTLDSVLDNHRGRLGAAFLTVTELSGAFVAGSGMKAADLTALALPLGPSLQEQHVIAELEGRLYDIFLLPMRAPDPFAWLISGYPLDDAEAMRSRNATGIDVSYLLRSAEGWQSPAASLSEARSRALARQLPPEPAVGEVLTLTGLEHDVLALPVRLPAANDNTLVLLSTSLDRALAPFNRLQSRLMLLAVLSILLSVAGIGVLAYRLIRPINRLAYQDTVTSLGNRALFNDKLQSGLAFSQKTGKPMTLLFMDLDRFKAVNDTLGHDVGDLVLVEVAQRIAGSLRHSDTIARTGGDEFAAILEGTDMEGAIEVAKHLLDAFEPPIVIDEHQIDVGTSIGIAVAPTHATSAVELLRLADMAMYQAKTARCGYVVCDPEDEITNPEELSMFGEIKTGLAEGRFHLRYAPVVRVADGRVEYADVSVYWARDDRGEIPASQFMTFAEQTGIAYRITRHALEQAVALSAEWNTAGLPVGVRVHVAAQDFIKHGLADFVKKTLDTAALPPSRLTLALSETSIDGAARSLEAPLTKLARMGVHIAIADYGSGAASLTNASRLPVSEVGFDREMVDIEQVSDKEQAIVRSSIRLCHELGLKVLATGVDSKRKAGLLATLGCDYLTGDVFGEPSDPEPLTRRLEAQLASSLRSVDSGEGAATAVNR